MSEWRPIETAPKGDVLLFWAATKSLPERINVGVATNHGPYRRPTHWQPLPDPPN